MGHLLITQIIALEKDIDFEIKKKSRAYTKMKVTMKVIFWRNKIN